MKKGAIYGDDYDSIIFYILNIDKTCAYMSNFAC